MDFRKELELMRQNYAKKPLKHPYLPRPAWLHNDDPLSALWMEKKELISHGTVYYAYVVQANNMLFHVYPPADCPANLLWSSDEKISENPLFLRDLAGQLYAYKGRPAQDIPEEWREIARVITDEYDRSAFSFSVNGGDTPMQMYFIANMVFRNHIPCGLLRSSLLPVLAVLDQCRSVLILPKRYWSKEFKSAWVKKML